MSGPSRVLLVDDDVAVRDALAQTLDLAGLRATTAGSFVAAKDHITRDFAGVILSDIRMPGRDGFHLLNYARDVDDELPVVLLTGEGDIPMAVSAIEQGAFDFLEKPCAPGDLVSVLSRALEARRSVLQARAERARAETGDPASRMIFGCSDLAGALRARVRKLAQTDEAILVHGPPGSGASKVAEVIHLCSARAHAAFEKRAAAGLDRAALRDAMQVAAHGALFLDEIGDLPADSQIALTEFLDAGHFARVMAGSTIALDEARLNSELHYRLQGASVRIPSIAERPEDIPILFRRYAEQACEQAGLKLPEITPDHMASLMAQDWPGNARSLMSAAMRFVLGMADDASDPGGLGLAEQMARVERSLLIAALSRQQGRASQAAKALKLPRKTFYDKLAKYGIRPEDFRD
ncbi:sigma-54 dependent transcriptional regulator [Sedimentitalea sp. JM2-8]|uniref:Sigma-54 dependent transcriptional regulator n=1 Tax=Sedimentitalea xiamensis TaxID=3050037 RepID=A0ABT7FB12_9RHOB|nr:sigma-54 dependent transcriptional regulator [Sedimentitalea xiamensis]MDK3072029.1 sigma-54 dependent transcriptional regulator [Sedimentitalea xiamensis]